MMSARDRRALRALSAQLRHDNPRLARALTSPVITTRTRYVLGALCALAAVALMIVGTIVSLLIAWVLGGIAFLALRRPADR